MIDCKWELVENGYCKCSRYVSYPTGLIIGHVEGKPFESSASWYASIDGTAGRKNIGTFTTEGLAKRAVEAAQLSLDNGKKESQ